MDHNKHPKQSDPRAQRATGDAINITSNDNSANSSVAYQQMQDDTSKSRTHNKSSSASTSRSSKFNRILGNLERSILSQFNGGASQESKSHQHQRLHHTIISNPIIPTKQTTGAKRKASADCATSSSSLATATSHSMADRHRENNGYNPVKSYHHNNIEHHQQHQQPMQEQSTSKDKITSSLKASVAKTASEKLGKLTLNSSKCQQQKSPRHRQQQQPSALRSLNQRSSMVANKLPIPPPHAHSEARTLNQAFLFTNEATQPTLPPASHTTTMMLLNRPVDSTTVHHSTTSSSDITSANANASSSSLGATLRRGFGACGPMSKLRGDKLRLEEQQHANRLSSSPASSAKSLPLVPARSASRANENNISPNNNSGTTNKQDEEESGFATYQSRRAILSQQQKPQQQHHHQSQSRSSPGGDSKGNEKMIFNRVNQQPSNFYPISQNQMISHVQSNQASQLMTSHQALRNHLAPSIMMQQSQQHSPSAHQFVPTMIMPNNQVPMIQTRDSNGNIRYLTYNQQVYPLNNYLLAQNCEQPQPQFQGNTVPTFQQAYYDNQLPMQLNPTQPSATDNDQQIYANAPPKPRRYQYYDATTANPSSNSVTGPTNMKIVPAQMQLMHHQVTNNLAMPMQQASYNLRSMLLPAPQTSYKPRLAGAPSMNNLSCFTIPNNPTNRESHIKNNQQHNFNNSQLMQHSSNQVQSSTHQPMGFPLVKSKSSLDAGDILRSRQSTNQANNSNNPANILNYRQQQVLRQSVYGLNNEAMMKPKNIISQPQVQSMRCVQPEAINAGNLQRSKSVTHLLSELDDESVTRVGIAQRVHQNQAPLHEQQRMISSLSSASANHLNVIGTSREAAQLPTAQSRSHLAHDINNYPPSQQFQSQMLAQKNSSQHQISSNSWAQSKMQAAQNLNSSNNIPNQSQFYRARSMAALNGLDLTFSNKSIRLQQPTPHGNVSQEISNFQVKPSLGDQIKHLLIDGDNSGGAGTMHASNQDDNKIYKAYDHNGRSFGLVPSTTNALIPARMSMAWSHNNGNDRNVLQQLVTTTHQHQQLQLPDKQTSSFLKDEQGNIVRKCSNANILANGNESTHAGRSQISASSLSLAEVNELSNMGNRQHRQYQVQQPNNAEALNRAVQTSRRQSDATNSQLIVDLTTPRVLAKTQTTLLPPTIGSSADTQNNSWSMNQVGLPQLSTPTSKAPPQPPTSTSNPSYLTVNVPTSYQPDQGLLKEQTSLKRAAQTNDTNTSSLERSAPYYYSDLKSEDQRRAFMNIVQQKSLSPPPQLLSRSIDQSSTRLAPRSATLHPGHARTLSENLAQRGSCVTDVVTQAGRRSIDDSTISLMKRDPAYPGDSPTSNIAKNIDKLFDRQFENHSTICSSTAQSMLTLNNHKESRDLSHISLDQASRGNANTESISSGYCSSELRSKNISKSKSLDNLSQKSLNNEAITRNKNPVYENIRCSNKLLCAINSSANRFNENKSSNTMSLAMVNTNSDESMDSILGSSLDDSDCCSDIIDEIKVSSTDNHINDITDLIEQLKINHSKITEEYKTTLVRIAKTVTTRNKQDGDKNNEKLSRRLNLLEMKSKRCESRSKNQLALIQMMEKVLRQSRLRAMSNRSSQQLVMSNMPQFNPPTSGIESTSSVTTASNSNQASHDGLSSLDSQDTKLSPSKDVDETDGLVLPCNLKSITDTKSDVNSKPPSSNVVKNSRPASQEIIKAIVVEKQTKTTEFVNMHSPRVDEVNHESPRQLIGQNGTHDDTSKSNVVRSSKNNSVTKRILDIETRNNGIQQQPTGDIKSKDGIKTNPFCDQSSEEESGSVSSSAEAQGTKKKQQQPRRYNEQSNDDDDDSLRDDEDFIEFLSNDSSGHRSAFGASQFSASDFNTSTSASESSNSCGAINDSLNSVPSPKRPNTGKKDQAKTNSEAVSPLTVGILKNSRRRSYDGQSNNNNERASPINGQYSLDSDSDKSRSMKSSEAGTVSTNGERSEESEKFKNVLGNVVDVDVCPMNTMTGCSPTDVQQHSS